MAGKRRKRPVPLNRLGRGYSSTSFLAYRKLPIPVRMAAVVEGQLTVPTREGDVTAGRGDRLALDTDGWPYPIARREFDAVYEGPLRCPFCDGPVQGIETLSGKSLRKYLLSVDEPAKVRVCVIPCGHTCPMDALEVAE